MTITSRTPWQKIATADLITCAEGPVGGDRDYLMQLTQQLDGAWAPWTRARSTAARFPAGREPVAA